ncbi:lipocalin family protein [Salinisphaera sp. T31B1]|uniref:lipocalin family protein n=1 Tax=Salinisphaera sp. T31B1 TaxID=727963 RepID=UPI003341C2C2
MTRSFGLSVDSIRPRRDFPRARHVDIDRYMRDWYVIAHKPPSITRTAHNAVERYRRGDDNRVDVRFTFRKNGFDGDRKTLRPTGFVVADTGNAVWAMQFVRPIKMQFVIAYVADDYRQTIVARERLDFVWIMASEPQIEAKVYDDLVERVRQIGYDVSQLRQVPQQPLGPRRAD